MDSSELKKCKNLLVQAQACLDAAMGEETDEGESDSSDAGDNSDDGSGDLAMNSMKMNLSKYKA